MNVFINGRILPEEDALIRASDRGFTLGDGIFETMRAQAGRIHCLDAHLERLRRSAERLRIPLPLGFSELPGALTNTLVANNLDSGDAALRLTLTRGPGPRGLPPPAKPDPNPDHIRRAGTEKERSGNTCLSGWYTQKRTFASRPN